MLRWSLVLASFAIIWVSADRNEFRLRDKWVPVIDKSEGGKYSKNWKGNHTWSISADPGSRIKVYCLDFRLPLAGNEEESCSHGRMLFDDGITRRRFCESQNNFQIYGNSSRLTIDLITSERGSGYLECVAKAVQQPRTYETIDLTPGDGIRGINFPAVRGQDNDKAWRFRSISNGKISLQCKKSMEGPLDTGVCVRDILTIDDGGGAKVSCSYEPVTTISRGSEITMRVETFPGTEGHVECIVQSITGPNANEADNVKYVEEDSSEHGVSPGYKGTTCPCGKANRDSGRIVNGTEVKYLSKYPFIVSMQTPGGGHFCGASIISPIHILTAAHCVSDRWTKNQPNPAELKPKVGIHNIWEDASHGESQRLNVREVHIPQTWFATKGSLSGDIAILVLETPIRFSKWVSPVCLTSSMPPIVNKYIKAMGWGRTENGYTDKLMEANVQVLDPLICNNNTREVCFKTGPSTTCYGDSGGPYVHVDPQTNRYTQVGLVSYGFGNCDGRFFIGTNTVHWFDWIQQIISATSGGYGICQKK